MNIRSSLISFGIPISKHSQSHTHFTRVWDFAIIQFDNLNLTME